MLADVIVIGGGVVGLSVAHRLAGRGQKVLVLERKKVASGFTRQSGGIIRQHNSDPAEVRLTVESLSFFEQHAQATGFQQVGFFGLAQGAEYRELVQETELLRGVGVDNHLVGPDELADRLPHLHLEGLEGGVFEPRGGFADPVATTRLMAELAKNEGAVIREGIELKQIRPGRLDTSRGEIPFSKVVLATGPWTPSLLPKASLPIQPRRGQLAFFRRPATLKAAPSPWIDFSSGLFSRPFGDDLFLTGLGHWDFEPIENPDRYRKRNDRAYLDAITGLVEARMPEVAAAGFERGYAAIYDVTPDWGAVVDVVPGYDGVYVVAGLSGTGFKCAPALGEAVADLVLEGRPPGPSFGLSRFAKPAASVLCGPGELPPLPIEPGWVKAGSPEARGLVLSTTPDGRVSTGFWSCTPGEFEWHFDYDEMIVLQEGEVTIRELRPGGRTWRLQAGDTATFPCGCSTYWKVTQSVRKFFVVREGPGEADQEF